MASFLLIEQSRVDGEWRDARASGPAYVKPHRRALLCVRPDPARQSIVWASEDEVTAKARELTAAHDAERGASESWKRWEVVAVGDATLNA